MEWILITPEVYYFCVAAVFLALSMTSRTQARQNYWVALVSSAMGVVITVAAVKTEGTFIDGVYQVDLFSQVFKAMLSLGLFLVVCLCTELESVDPRRHSDFYLLLMLCTLAMMVLVSSIELVTLYVALELTSYCLYILVAVRRGHAASDEAGLKYFLIGAVTSAIMLFGMALLFGAVGSTSFREISRVLPGAINTPMVFIGLLMTVSGFFLKLALFPFHVWAPSVYQGAPNQITAYIATASKVTAIALIIRIISLSGGESTTLVQILIFLAITSMTLGNLVAIVQKDIKRLLAYSAVAHAGYVLVGILSMNESGYAGAIFYASAYLVMSFICFLVIIKVAQDGNNIQIAQLAGLHGRAPLLSVALMVGVFSLGGLPPTIGFTGKFLVFTAAMQKGYFYLVVISMINVVISLYYYALIVKAAYLTEPEEALPPVQLTVPAKLLTLAMIVLTVAGGIFPGKLYTLAEAAARALI